MFPKKYKTVYRFIGMVSIASILYYYYQKAYEFFSGGYILFYTKLATAAFLLRDEDGYISSMTTPDLYARHVKSHQEYREKSAASALEFQEEQKLVLEKAVEKAQLFFQTVSIPYIDRERMIGILWKFALTKNNIYEDGLPHTREDVIFVTPKLLELPEAQLVKTLIHEKVHIYQRVYESQFQDQLKSQGYTIWRERRGYPLIRSNPDLDNYIYRTPRGDIMVTVYSSSQPQHIQDTMQPNALKEHPYEEIAYQIAEMYKGI